MSKMFQFILEIVRILLLLALAGAAAAVVSRLIFPETISQTSSLLIGWSFYSLFFVLYRNKFQQSGWFRSRYNKPLSRLATKVILFSSLIAFILAYMLNFGKN